MIVGATLAVVIVLGAVAFFVTRSENNSDKAAISADTGAQAAQNAKQEQASVTVIGEPLAAYPQTSSMVAPPAEDPAVGQTPPVLEGFSFDGKPVKIDPADGRAKVVIFVAHWCPHCQAEVPLIQKWIDEGNQPENVDFYGVSTSVKRDQPNYPPSKWIIKEGFTPQVMLDNPSGTAAQAYALPGFPYFVMMDSSGKVTQRASGEVPIDQFGTLVTALGSQTPTS
jgi:thiol-disulfide isomerase/thioredoxin